MTPNENVNHTRGRLNKDEFDADDLGPSRAKHRADYHYRHRAGAVPYRVLDRMIRAGVGKPWHKTHSKLSDKFDRRTDVGTLVWQHINREVDDRAFIGEDGAVYHVRGYYDFFVHPTTGVLCEIPRKRYDYSPKKNPDEIVLDKDHILMREHGIWYLYTYHMVEEAHVRSKRVVNLGPDFMLKPYVYEPVVCYEMVRHLLDKHQLNHKELVKRGLKNSPDISVPSHRERAARKRAA